MKYAVLLLGVFIIFMGLNVYNDEIASLERAIERNEVGGIGSYDDAMRVRDLRQRLADVEENSYIITAAGTIISFGGVTMFFKKSKKKLWI